MWVRGRQRLRMTALARSAHVPMLVSATQALGYPLLACTRAARTVGSGESLDSKVQPVA